MRRAVYALAVTAVLAAASAALPRGRVDLWAVVRDGAQEVLSATFSVSAAVLNWLEDDCERS